MVTKETLKNGVLTYIDSEIIPHLPSPGRWGVGALIVLLTPKYDMLYDNLVNTPMMHTLGIIDEQGLVNSDALVDALSASAEKYGKMTVSFPVIGTLSFSKEDVDKLKQYIKSSGGDQYR